VHPRDFWVLRYMWDTEEQQEVLASLVKDAIEKHEPRQSDRRHPRAHGGDAPDPECLARDLEQIEYRLAQGETPATERSYLRDRLGLLAARCPWVRDEQQRTFLQKKVDAMLAKMGESR
jgi:MoxR-like ATPase